jgi:HEAT repeat protein
MFLHIVRTLDGYAVQAAPTAQDPATSPIALLASDEATTHDEVYRGLVRLGSLAVMPLLAALFDANPIIRREAARVLGDISDPLAGPALQRALSDAEPMVRQAAARSLEALQQNGPTSMPPDAPPMAYTA